jgi:hypothetical protein
MLTGHSQLGRRKRDPAGDRTKPGNGTRIAICRGTEQLSCLTAKLIKVGPVGKSGHHVSSPPGLAFGRDTKTILPQSTMSEAVEVEVEVEVDSGPAREPGGALLRHYRHHTMAPL